MSKRNKTDEFVYGVAVLLAVFGWFGLIVMLSDDSVDKGWRWIAISLIVGSVTLFYYDHEHIKRLENEVESRRIMDGYLKKSKNHKN